MTTIDRPSGLLRSWEAFDRLFDEAFAPKPNPSPAFQSAYVYGYPATYHEPSPISAAHNMAPSKHTHHQRRRTYSTFEPSVSYGGAMETEWSDPDEDFQKLWEEAARRKRRVTRTVTRRRTLKQGSMTSSSTMVNDEHHPDLDAVKAEHRKTQFHLHQPPDSDTVTATFELPDVRKEDVHVAFQQDRLTITYFSIITTESHNVDQTLLRERKERKYARTLPLPAGTQFDDIKAFLEDGRLTVSYPKHPSGKPTLTSQ